MNILYNEIPHIVNVSYLRSYDLLIEFDNGEERVLDVSDSFNIPMALQYAPMSEFKKFSFDKNEIWWGDLDSPECMEIGRDSIYNLSMPIPAFTSSVFLSMGYVSNRADKFITADMRIMKNEVEDPHVHIVFPDKSDYRVRLYDIEFMDSPAQLKSKVIKEIKSWVLGHKEEAIKVWNDWNPQTPADPSTGKRTSTK